ncbi:serine threonine-protein kinase [Ancistrocladus abbreviatus]
MDDEKPETAQVQEVPILNFDQVKVVSPVGRGAKGVVFHIRLNSSNEDLALKVVSKTSFHKRSNKVEDDNGVVGEKKDDEGNKESRNGRICFEQRVLRSFRHPLLPRLRGIVETEDIVGYAIDYCPGRDLNSLRKQQSEKMFSDDIIRFYGAELVLSLEYLHGLGIVYRDLKPENILIQENGHLMLVDFDLSTKLAPRSPKTQVSLESVKKPEPSKKNEKKTHFPKFSHFCNSGITPEESVATPGPPSASAKSAESDTTEKSNSFVGTEDYVAPEMIKGEGHDFAVDWWCFGVVLYEMLYGTTPFRGANRKETFYRVLTKEPDLVGEATPLRDLIRKLLEKDPKKRISVEGIKEHDFFRGVDWNMILKISRPPFIPERPEMVEGTDGIKAIDVESFVQRIFEEREAEKENMKKNNTDNGNVENCNKNREEENFPKGVWVEGLDHRLEPRDFLVF